MLGQQFATILARTDPFDVAQGLDRHIRTMSGPEIRALIQSAAARMNDGYRAEFLPLLDEQNDSRLQRAFAQSLRSNLRAIPLFGSTFCEGVIAKVPGDRTVGLGEEGRGLRMRPVGFAIIAAALLIGGAAAEHVLSTARANANTPVVLTTPEPLVTAQPVAAAAQARPVASVPPRATKTPAPTAPPVATRSTAVAAAAAPAVAPPPAERPARTIAPPPRRRTPPPGSGVKTIIAQQPRPTPTPEPTAVDVTDMPQAYSDATPLPSDATPPPAAVDASALHVATPTPAPNRSWTHRLAHAAVHIVNSTLTVVGVSKKPSQPKPTASPSGPQP